jgi:hypothetical protein
MKPSFKKFVTNTDYLFGYRPQLLHGRQKRFQSFIGGILQYTYLMILLIYAVVLAIQLRTDEIIGLKKDYQYIHTMDKQEREELEARVPDFNMGFGFVGKEMDPSIG